MIIEPGDVGETNKPPPPPPEKQNITGEEICEAAPGGKMHVPDAYPTKVHILDTKCLPLFISHINMNIFSSVVSFHRWQR